jgi:hypothetical protein
MIVAMMGQDHFSILGGKASGGGRPLQASGVAATLVFAAVAGAPVLPRADEGGGSFWQSGTYDSLAAVPDQPGWSFSATYNHASTSAGAAVAAAREISIGRLDPNLRVNLNANTNATADSIVVSPGYTFATPVLGARAAVSVSTALARSSTALAGTLTATLARSPSCDPIASATR